MNQTKSKQAARFAKNTTTVHKDKDEAQDVTQQCKFAHILSVSFLILQMQTNMFMFPQPE